MRKTDTGRRRVLRRGRREHRHYARVHEHGLDLEAARDLCLREQRLRAGYAGRIRARLRPDVADRAAAYRMPGVTVDGQDVLAVCRRSRRGACDARAPAKARRSIECMTYRYYGHHQGDDPLRYRLADEEQAARDARLPDAVPRADGGGRAAAGRARRARRAATGALDEAVEFAEASPLPEPHELYTDVYVLARKEVAQ